MGHFFNYYCKVRAIQGNTNITHSLSIDSSNLTQKTYQFKASISQETEFPCKDSPDVTKKTVDGFLTAAFNYSISLRPDNTNPKEEQFKTTETLSRLVHRFFVINMGPSPTDRVESFHVFIPGIVDQSKIILRPENVANPLMNKCNADHAKRICWAGCACFEFEIKKGFEKARRLTVEVEMYFDPNIVKNSSSSFEVISALVKQRKVVPARTTFKEIVEQVGLIETVSEMWPMIVGVLVGSIIVASSIYAMYKTDPFLNKVRFTKNKLEKNEGKIRVQKNLHLSIKP